MQNLHKENQQVLIHNINTAGCWGKVIARTRGGQNQLNIEFYYKGFGIISIAFSDPANQTIQFITTINIGRKHKR